jgi:hypothetical protein
MGLLTIADPTKSGSIDITVPEGHGFAAIFNNSDYSLTASTSAGTGAYLPARQHRNIPLDKPLTRFSWSNPVLSTSQAVGLQQLVFEVYGQSELRNNVLASLTSSNLANTSSSNVLSSQSIANDGNTPGTSVIETSIGGVTYISVTNDGVMHYKILSNNVLTEVLTIVPSTTAVATVLFHGTADNAAIANNANNATNASAATNATNLTGGSLTSTGVASLDGGTITTTGAGSIVGSGNAKFGSYTHETAGSYNGRDSFASTKSLLALLNTDNDAHLYCTPANGKLKITNSSKGADIAQFQDSSGLTLIGDAPINFSNGFLHSIGSFSGTGNGTFNHNAGGTPYNVQATCKLSGSTQTMGAAAYSSTQVTINTGSGLAWTALAFR